MTFELALAIGFVFATVAVVSAVLASSIMVRLSPERRRLDALTATATTGVVLPGTRSLEDTDDPRLRRLLQKVPKSPAEMGRLKKRLARAGYHGALPVVIYSAMELALPLGVFLGVVALLGARPGFLALGALLALVAYMTPGLVLHRLIVRRQRQIRNGLPDAIDLLIVCMEAGSSLDQSVVKASEELDVSYPHLAEELRYVNTEIRAGKPRLEAFKNFSERTKVDDVRALVAMLVQTDRFGTSVAQALRIFASAARVKRRQEAEERAGKLGVKLLFPLVFCLFPAMFIVVLGPAMLRIIRMLMSIGR